MIDDKRASPFDALDLDGIGETPRPRRRERHEIDATASTPSREPSRVRQGRVQMNLSLKMAVDARYTALCEREGASKAKMLEKLMDRWECRR